MKAVALGFADVLSACPGDHPIVALESRDDLVGGDEAVAVGETGGWGGCEYGFG